MGRLISAWVIDPRSGCSVWFLRCSFLLLLVSAAKVTTSPTGVVPPRSPYRLVVPSMALPQWTHATLAFTAHAMRTVTLLLCQDWFKGSHTSSALAAPFVTVCVQRKEMVVIPHPKSKARFAVAALYAGIPLIVAPGNDGRLAFHGGNQFCSFLLMVGTRILFIDVNASQKPSLHHHHATAETQSGNDGSMHDDSKTSVGNNRRDTDSVHVRR